MARKMPVLFIGHGSPMNVVLENSFTRSLAQWGKRLPRPEAIMVISARWLTSGTYVTCMEKPRIIYDFYGFPEELYAITYPSPGAPTQAQYVSNAVRNAPVRCNYDWGLDHASWAVLKHLFPKADIPVFELSLDYTFNDWCPKPLQYYYDLAGELAEMRRRGVLIIGSGNHRDLIQFRNLGKSGPLAVPTLDHYLPMLYVIALQEQGETLAFTNKGFQHGAISMRCFQIG